MVRRDITFQGICLKLHSLSPSFCSESDLDQFRGAVNMSTKMIKIITDDRIGYLLIILLIVTASYVSINITGEIHPAARGFYNAIEALKPGDMVIIQSEVRTMMAWEFYAAGTAGVKRILEKGANIIWYSVYDEAQMNDIILFNELFGSPFQKNPMYGERFIYLGYVPFSVSSVYQMAVSLRSIRPTDFFGKSLDDFPISKNVDSAGDFQLCYGISRPQELMPPYWMEQGVPVICAGDSGYSEFIKDYNSGILAGLLAGVKFGYAYEQMIGEPGKSFRFNTSMIFLSLLQIFGIIGINVVWLSQRKLKVEK